MKNKLYNEKNDNLRWKAITSVFIKLLERFISMGSQVVFSIIIARFLTPDAYGIMAITSIFIVLSTVLVESGLSVGIVQKKELTSLDIYTMFWASVVLSFCIYIFIYFLSPFVAEFYKLPEVSSILRVYAISIFFTSTCSICNGLISRKLEYNNQLKSSVLATFISGIIGVYLCFLNLGVWTLVVQYLIQQFLYMVFLLYSIKFIPKIQFSPKSFKVLFSFSSKILFARIISSIYIELRNIIIGKLYDSNTLGLFYKGRQIPATVATATDYSLQGVMFSVYSKVQDDTKTLKYFVKRSMKLSSYILFPMLFGLAAIAEPLVDVLLTDKWANCVPFFRIACLNFALQPLCSSNVQAINSMGRSDLTLKIELENKFFALLIIFISSFFSVYIIAASVFVTQLIALIQFSCLSNKIIDYGFTEQLYDIYPELLISTVMACSVYSLSSLNISSLSLMIIQIIFGIFLFVILSHVFRMKSYIYILENTGAFRIYRK